MVHGVHALPSGNRTGPFGGAAELPNHGHGLDGNGSGQRLVARRGHGRCGSDGDVVRCAPPAPSQSGQEPVLGGRGCVPPNPERAPHPCGPPRHRHGRDDARSHARRRGGGRRLRLPRSVPRRQRGSGRPHRICRRHGRARGAHRLCGRFDGVARVEESRCHGGRRGGGKLPTVWRSHGIRRSARGLFRGARVLQAPLPRPNHRRVRRPLGTACVAHGPSNP